AELADAIPYGYECMDRLLGDFFALAGEDTTLIFCTALSQQPCLIYEEQGGKVFFRPRDFEALLRCAGVEGRFPISPVMSHYFHVHCAGEREAAAAAELLRALEVDGSQAIHVDVNGSVLFCGCRIYRTLSGTTVLRSARTGRETPFFELFYQ